MKIICARLATGEEIIGKVLNNAKLLTENKTDLYFSGDIWDIPNEPVTLEDVRIVAIQQVPGRGVGISFIPYSLANPAAKIKIDLSKHAMSVYKAEENLERAYIGENSQIQLATPESARQSGIALN